MLIFIFWYSCQLGALVFGAQVIFWHNIVNISMWRSGFCFFSCLVIFRSSGFQFIWSSGWASLDGLLWMGSSEFGSIFLMLLPSMVDLFFILAFLTLHIFHIWLLLFQGIDNHYNSFFSPCHSGFCSMVPARLILPKDDPRLIKVLNSRWCWTQNRTGFTNAPNTELFELIWQVVCCMTKILVCFFVKKTSYRLLKLFLMWSPSSEETSF